MQIDELLRQAVGYALSRDNRNYFHAAIGVRADGAIVHARNEHAHAHDPAGHAEYRLGKKLGKNAPLVIVVRVNRLGEFRPSKPCSSCEAVLKRAKVKNVIWTSGPGTWEKERYC